LAAANATTNYDSVDISGNWIPQETSSVYALARSQILLRKDQAIVERQARHGLTVDYKVVVTVVLDDHRIFGISICVGPQAALRGHHRPSER
jgi:hypothetical protein